ncbi:hypothetical protein Vadar_025053 [Vaccinium darrowii]|uniref:Uncharacterized protein n=1 Tax=Vaccinium darrowii TaxID=229202 RepID=A0ACB7YZ37_9ERIC|nr:hypothetical protein Vadar_025053 [Vaccinium darrowii]
MMPSCVPYGTRRFPRAARVVQQQLLGATAGRGPAAAPAGLHLQRLVNEINNFRFGKTGCGDLDFVEKGTLFSGGFLIVEIEFEDFSGQRDGVVNKEFELLIPVRIET